MLASICNRHQETMRLQIPRAAQNTFLSCHRATHRCECHCVSVIVPRIGVSAIVPRTGVRGNVPEDAAKEPSTSHV